MILYDISQPKLLQKLSRFLKRYGVRVQYSVFIVATDDERSRVVLKTLNLFYKPKLHYKDSIIILPLNDKSYESTLSLGCSTMPNFQARIIKI
jgi:CRISPR-associated endonuclease Cas2